MTVLTPNRSWPLPNNGSATGGIDLNDDIQNLIDAFLGADDDVQALFSSLAGKADIANPNFTGVPTAPTATAGTDSGQLATTAFVQQAVANLVASSPAALDTLNELAAALGDDPNFAATMTTQLSLKANAADVYTISEVDAALADKLDLDGGNLADDAAKLALANTFKMPSFAGAQTPTAPQILQFKQNFELTGYEHLGRIPFSAAYAVDLGDVSAYRGLRITGNYKTDSATSALALQLSVDGITWVTANYYMSAVSNANGAVQVPTGALYSGVRLWVPFSGTVGSKLGGVLEVFNLKSEDSQPVIAEVAGYLLQGSQHYKSNSSYYMDGGGVYAYARLISLDGTVTGAINVWGIR